MKKWNAPEVAELNIAETAGGFLKLGFEGPLDIVFGDFTNKGNDKDGNNKDATTDTEVENGSL